MSNSVQQIVFKSMRTDTESVAAFSGKGLSDISLFAQMFVRVC